MGERRVSSPRLARTLTLCRWSQMGSLLHAILALPTQPLHLVLFVTGRENVISWTGKRTSLESDNWTSTKRDI